MAFSRYRSIAFNPHIYEDGVAASLMKMDINDEQKQITVDPSKITYNGPSDNMKLYLDVLEYYKSLSVNNDNNKIISINDIQSNDEQSSITEPGQTEEDGRIKQDDTPASC